MPLFLSPVDYVFAWVECPTIRLQEHGVSTEELVVILEEIESKEPVPQLASVIGLWLLVVHIDVNSNTTVDFVALYLYYGGRLKGGGTKVFSALKIKSIR